MDINSVYNKIIEKLRETNNLDIVEGLERSSMGASTGSEALVLTGNYLSNLKQNNPAIFQLIKEQIMDYFEYCKQNGLVIR
jgi:hypothetical protein